MKENKKVKYLDEFPIIIVASIIMLIIILIMMYLRIKPHETIYRNGYMVLSGNMTYNLMNNVSNEDDLNIGVATVSNGDYVYKQMDSYFVGVEKKVEVDYEYPLYSKDGLTIYNLNKNTTLINEKFEKLEGYPGLSLNYGTLYNDGDSEPADENDYLFLDLNNSIHITAQTVVIKTLSNEYTIPMHSPIHFDIDYVNYYIFDGKQFEYNAITDIYYDSIVKIGDVTLTYKEFLVQMGLNDASKLDFDEDEITGDSDDDKDKDNEEQHEEESNEGEAEIVFVKPVVKVLDFESNVYSIESNLSVQDTAGVITTSPTFEIYTVDDKLYSRKKFSNSGDIKISGLSSSTEYKIVGTYKYKNQNGVIIEHTFHESVITTNNISELEEIELESRLGEIYPDKLEIKDLKILNNEIEAVSGIKKVVLNVWEENTDSIKKYDLSYSDIVKLMNGENVTMASTKTLSSDTVYEYNISFFDKDDNELKNSGIINEKIKTSKKLPIVKATVEKNKETNYIGIDISVTNADNVYIKDFKYEIYSYSGFFVDEGIIDYKNESLNSFGYDNLDYNTNYVLRITGTYDVEDGKGEKKLFIEKDFTTANLNSNFVAWYDAETVDVSYNYIKPEIYISSSALVLEKRDTQLVVTLVDKDGNDILDNQGKPKYSKKYGIDEYKNELKNEYYVSPKFDNLESGVEYNIKLEIIVKQLDNKPIVLSKILSPSIETKFQDAYMTVINKTLVGGRLDLTLEITDFSEYITSKELIIEVYEGKYDSVESIKDSSSYIKYVYRDKVSLENLSKDTPERIEIPPLEGYDNDSYTIIVGAKPYNGSNVIKYLATNDTVGTDNEINVINVDKAMDAYVEMYEQLNRKTQLSYTYNLYDAVSNIYFIDCVGSSCVNLGYFDSKDVFHKVNGKTDIKNIGHKKIIEIDNSTRNGIHTFYIALEKNLGRVESTIPKAILENNMYILDYLEYNSDYQIYNISSASDFFNTALIKKNKETRRYVVTEDIVFGDGINSTENMVIANYFTNFEGEIDFQGYRVELHKTNTSSLNLFSTVSAKGVLKNLVLDYYLDYDGVIGASIPGFVNTNGGKLENIVMYVTQTNENGRGYALGLLSYTNNGKINNFAVYLNSHIRTFSGSSLLSYTNGKAGIISNGYITSGPNQNETMSIMIYDLIYRGHGTVTNENSGEIRNVYNLINIQNMNSGNTSPMASIAHKNQMSGKIKNCISEATLTNNKPANGPNVWVNNAGKVSNNFYVETNAKNANYTNSLNTRINKASLMNSSVWEVILNSDRSFSVTSGYYPILKMSKFMKDEQQLVKIPFDYFNSAKIDILSSEVIHNNIESIENIENNCGVGYGCAKVYISNPEQYYISDVKIEDLTAEIVERTFDENLQATELKLKLSINDKDKTKSKYYISGFDYYISEDSMLAGEPYSTTSYDKEKNSRVLDIEMYRRISDYDKLISSINSNENIYLMTNLNATAKLPDAKTYSGTFEGNEKIIDFLNLTINRGYFFYGLSGTLKNLGIKNVNFKKTSSSDYVGFIRTISNSSIANVDISNVNIHISTYSSTNYIGTIAGNSSASNLFRVSANNVTISSEKNTTSTNRLIIGGLIGSSSSTEIDNSYVYGINVTKANNMEVNGISSLYDVGGIAGVCSSCIIRNCYTTGLFDTDYSRMGGIVGTASSATVTNNYSYMQIKTEGDDTGGIVGYGGTTSVSNNMFIGQLVNRNLKSNVSVIGKGASTTNYALKSGFKLISNVANLTEFDKNGQFIENIYDSVDLPYLNETSFVEQQIKNDNFVNFDDSNIDYNLTYSNEQCKAVIKDVNSGVEVDSALYKNACANSATLTINGSYSLDYEFVDGVAETDELKITTNANATYKLEPKKYFNYYSLKYKDSNGNSGTFDVNAKFYRKISSAEDWNNILSKENIILIQNIVLDFENYQNNFNKRITNFLGNGYSIKSYEEGQEVVIKNKLIDSVLENMRDVYFNNFKIISDSVPGLITYNESVMTNCSFSNITIESKVDKTAIISNNRGNINNIKLENIHVKSTKNYVAALVASSNYTNSRTTVKNIVATSDNKPHITVSGNSYVGGIIASVSYGVSGITVSNVDVSGNGHVGGIAGYANCSSCSITDSTVTGKSSYIGGIAGRQYSGTTLNNFKSINVEIKDGNPNSSKSYVGGIYGMSWYLTNAEVNNLNIGNFESVFNANYVGGVAGYSGRTAWCSVKESTITGKNTVGGMFGISLSYTNNVYYNLVEESNVIASIDEAGGLIGRASGISETNNTIIENNIVIKSTVIATNKSGGLIGKITNTSTSMQGLYLRKNLVIGTSISGNLENSGSLIGTMSQIPTFANISYNNNFFHKIKIFDKGMKLVGKIENKTTGSESGYGTSEISEIDFANVGNFKEYVDYESEINQNGIQYQINSITDLGNFISPLTAYKFVDTKYFPVFANSQTNSYKHLIIENMVPISYDSNVGTLNSATFMSPRMLSTRINNYNNPINIDYDVYTVGVNKVNIEFSEIDSSVMFYYKIGDYISKYIPINSRTYTITYDFKNPIELYITNGSNYIDATIKPNDIAKTLTIVDGKTYYINNNMLFSESKMITGDFKNVYGVEALTNDGKIYNLKTKTETEAYTDYNVMLENVPLYEFVYGGQIIKTYYNYSTVNNVIKNYQLFVKNGALSSISPSLDNKKDMYIVDFYNNNEIQIVLKNDNKLYSLKENIKYPKNIINKEIIELYSNINSTDNIVVIKHNNGAIYTFDYRTGENLFTNVSNKDISFIDYIKNKMGEGSNNVIPSVATDEKYKEMEQLKTKIINISLSEAEDKLYNSNNSIPNKGEYITVYNDLTKNYDVYNVSALVNDTVDVDSETEKMYQNYELVHFYNTLGRENKKNSVSGIIMFAISIVFVLSALALLIRHRLRKKGGIA